MKRQGAQALLDGREELGAWASDPLAALCRRGSRCHVPGRRKGAEMIQSNHVDVGQERAKAVDVPAISALPKRVPVVDGVAPQLPFRAEVVGRHARRRPSAGGRCQARRTRGGPRRHSSRATRKTADHRSSARPCHARAAAGAPPAETAGTGRSERARSAPSALDAPSPRPGGSAGRSRLAIEVAGAVVSRLQRAE